MSDDWMQLNFGKRRDGNGTARMTAEKIKKQTPTSQPNGAFPSAERARNEPEPSQKQVPVKNAPAHSPLAGRTALGVCGLYE